MKTHRMALCYMVLGLIPIMISKAKICAALAKALGAVKL